MDSHLITSYFERDRTIFDISPSGVLIEWTGTGSWNGGYNYVYVDSADMSFFTVCSNLETLLNAYIEADSYIPKERWEKIKEESVVDTIQISKEPWEIIDEKEKWVYLS